MSRGEDRSPEDRPSCPYCGEVLRGDGSFCTACGTDLNAQDEEVEYGALDIPDYLVEDADEETYREAGLGTGPKEIGSTGIRTMIIGLGGIVLVGIVIVAVILMIVRR